MAARACAFTKSPLSIAEFSAMTPSCRALAAAVSGRCTLGVALDAYWKSASGGAAAYQVLPVHGVPSDLLTPIGRFRKVSDSSETAEGHALESFLFCDPNGN